MSVTAKERSNNRCPIVFKGVNYIGRLDVTQQRQQLHLHFT